jgi:hypothetical protein
MQIFFSNIVDHVLFTINSIQIDGIAVLAYEQLQKL